MNLELITAEAVKYKGVCHHVLLPGVKGEMGVLASHAPLVSMLDPGLVRVDTPGGSLHFAVSQGFATVSGEDVVCLVDAAMEPKEVKVDVVQSRINQLEGEMSASAVVQERMRQELKYLRAQLTLAGRV